jgi:hypothetical protein
MRPSSVHTCARRAASHSSRRGLAFAFRRMVAVVATVAVSQGVVTVSPAFAEPQVPRPPAASAAPSGTVPGAEAPAAQTPTSPPVAAARMESWTPTSHSVTVDGETTLDLFPQPAFKRGADGWTAIDSTITPGSGDYPFEALELANPVHFGLTADALVTIDTVSGPVVFGLEGATVNTPTLSDGVITYPGVFPGVDLAGASASTWSWPTSPPDRTSNSPSPTRGTRSATRLRVRASPGRSPRRLPSPPGSSCLPPRRGVRRTRELVCPGLPTKTFRSQGTGTRSI